MGTQTKRPVRPAKSEEVIPPLEQSRIDPKWHRHFEHLLDLREELLRRKGDHVQYAHEGQPAFSLDMADAATDNYDRDYALSVISSNQNALYEIEEALRRMRDGNYGICVVTGKPIESGRLTAIPWTRFSAEAEKHLEEQGEISSAKLGDISRLTSGSKKKSQGKIE
jgi:DnaK suppressor protein